ncbi:hypothetical protein D3C81_1403640 [compost metagenome]
MSEAVTTVVNDTVAPTDKSNPSTASESVTPIATKVTIAIEFRISLKLLYVKKYGNRNEKKAITNTTTTKAPYLKDRFSSLSFIFCSPPVLHLRNTMLLLQ